MPRSAAAGPSPTARRAPVNARQGSTRAPHFVGGGVAFAPKPRSYAQRTPKKMVRLALRSALSDRASESKVALLDRFSWETPKTQATPSRCSTRSGSTAPCSSCCRATTASRRGRCATCPSVTTVDQGELNAHDVLAHDWVLFTDETLPTAAAPTTPADGTDDEDDD